MNTGIPSRDATDEPAAVPIEKPETPIPGKEGESPCPSAERKACSESSMKPNADGCSDAAQVAAQTESEQAAWLTSISNDQLLDSFVAWLARHKGHESPRSEDRKSEILRRMDQAAGPMQGGRPSGLPVGGNADAQHHPAQSRDTAPQPDKTVRVCLDYEESEGDVRIVQRKEPLTDEELERCARIIRGRVVDPAPQPDADKALADLVRKIGTELTPEGNRGCIVSSADMGECLIAQCRARGMFAVDANGYGYGLVKKHPLMAHLMHDEEQLEGWNCRAGFAADSNPVGEQPRWPGPEGAVFLGRFGQYDLLYRVHDGIPENDYWFSSCKNEEWDSCYIGTTGIAARDEACRRAASRGFPLTRDEVTRQLSEATTRPEWCPAAQWEDYVAEKYHPKQREGAEGHEVIHAAQPETTAPSLASPRPGRPEWPAGVVELGIFDFWPWSVHDGKIYRCGHESCAPGDAGPESMLCKWIHQRARDLDLWQDEPARENTSRNVPGITSGHPWPPETRVGKERKVAEPTEGPAVARLREYCEAWQDVAMTNADTPLMVARSLLEHIDATRAALAELWDLHCKLDESVVSLTDGLEQKIAELRATVEGQGGGE